MLRWFSRSSSTDAAPENHSPSEEEEEAVPPPVPLRLGVPMHACCLAVDPMQGTIAVGNSYGDVQLFGTGGTKVQLPPPSSAETKPFAPAVMSLLWDINEGRLVVVHAPNLVRVWCIRGVAARLTASLRVGRAKSAVVVATMPPRSGGLSLFGTVDMAVAACDVTRGRTSHWSLDVSSGGDEAAGGGALCALELRPADPALRLLVAVHAGALRVFRLGGKGGGEASAPLLLGSHPEGVPLWCAAWLCDGLSDGLGALVGAGGVAGSVAAGYANGDVLTFSLRGQGAPAAASPAYRSTSRSRCWPFFFFFFFFFSAGRFRRVSRRRRASSFRSMDTVDGRYPPCRGWHVHCNSTRRSRRPSGPWLW